MFIPQYDSNRRGYPKLNLGFTSPEDIPSFFFDEQDDYDDFGYPYDYYVRDIENPDDYEVQIFIQTRDMYALNVLAERHYIIKDYLILALETNDLNVLKVYLKMKIRCKETKVELPEFIERYGIQATEMCIAAGYVHDITKSIITFEKRKMDFYSRHHIPFNTNYQEIESQFKRGYMPASYEDITDLKIIHLLEKYEDISTLKSKLPIETWQKFIGEYQEKFDRSYPNVNIPKEYYTYINIIDKLASFAKSDDAQSIKKLNQDSKISDQDLDDALLEAVDSGSYKCIDLLISYGADPNACCDGKPLVSIAFDNGDNKAVKMLVKAGAKTPKVNKSQLIDAIKEGNEIKANQVLHELASNNISMLSDVVEDCLLIAEKKKMINIFKNLVDITKKLQIYPYNAIMEAIDLNLMKFMEILVNSHGFPPNYKTGFVEECIEKDNEPMARYIMKNGAILSTLDFPYKLGPKTRKLIDEMKEIQDSIIKSCRFETSDQLGGLLNKGLYIDIKDSDGKTAFAHAANNLNYKAVERLLDSGANINTKDNTNSTPLFILLLRGKYNMCKKLIDCGADPNVVCSRFDSLHAAAYGGSLDNVKLILSQGLTFKRDECYRYGSVEVAEYLISHGIKMNISSVEYQRKPYRKEVLDYLRKIMMDAYERGDKVQIEYLLSLNIPDIPAEERPKSIAPQFRAVEEESEEEGEAESEPDYDYNDELHPNSEEKPKFIRDDVIIRLAILGKLQQIKPKVEKMGTVNFNNEAGLTLFEASCISGNVALVLYVLDHNPIIRALLLSPSFKVAKELEKRDIKCIVFWETPGFGKKAAIERIHAANREAIDQPQVAIEEEDEQEPEAAKQFYPFSAEPVLSAPAFAQMPMNPQPAQMQMQQIQADQVGHEEADEEKREGVRKRKKKKRRVQAAAMGVQDPNQPIPYSPPVFQPAPLFSTSQMQQFGQPYQFPYGQPQFAPQRPISTPPQFQYPQYIPPAQFQPPQQYQMQPMQFQYGQPAFNGAQFGQLQFQQGFPHSVSAPSSIAEQNAPSPWVEVAAPRKRRKVRRSQFDA